jgi:P-type Ca2+ transporter type 2C
VVRGLKLATRSRVAEVSIAGPGLTAREAEERLRELGPNTVPAVPPPTLLRRILRQLASPLIYVLMFAVAFDVASAAWTGDGWPIEGAVIASMLLLNAALGVAQERRADGALAELARMASPTAWAWRDSALVRIATTDLVPGDRVRLEAGERIPADGTLVGDATLMIDESMLTGESDRVEKGVAADVFAGTLVVRGQSAFDVTRTGVSSALGRLAVTLADVAVDRAPLERQIAHLGSQITRWVAAISIGLAIAGVLAHGVERIHEVVLFAVVVAVAAVPEGMPAVVTLTLSLGMQRMARRNAIVRRLGAVEALGAITVIATDKTGTLTENRMRVHALEAADDAVLVAMHTMVLANDADDDSDAGDPIEVALLAYAREKGLDPATFRRAHPRISVRPFDSAWKFMRVTVATAQGPCGYVKGAPEVVLARCRLEAQVRESWAARAEAAAADGQRVLALARGDGERECELELVGLVALTDPLRGEAQDAIRRAQAAGVRVVMLTGDHPATARAIARRAGFIRDEVCLGADLDGLTPETLREIVATTDVFARVSPDHKLAIVDALKANGEIVAVTGDGVNDAPALKRADVGIAMGFRGSDVAREVSDVVLVDDNFATIVAAMEEGRNIDTNIQSYLRFTLSTNFALVVMIVLGTIGAIIEGLRDTSGLLVVPLSAVQLLWINFLGDGPPAIVLALDRRDGVMNRPPRVIADGLLDAASWRFIVAAGVLQGVLGLAMLLSLPRIGLGLVAVQTAIFEAFAIGKLLSMYDVRSDARRNPAIIVAVIAGLVLQVLTMTVPALRAVLGLAPIATELALAAAIVVAVTLIGRRVIARWSARGLDLLVRQRFPHAGR